MKGISVLVLFWLCAAPSSWALQYVINLYLPAELEKHGIAIEVKERESGALDCVLRFDQEKVGVTSLELFGKSKDGEYEMDLRTRRFEGNDVAEFTLSRSQLMHATFKVGLRDSVPGGSFLQVGIVDMVEFGDLSPALQKRQERLKTMGFLKSKALEDRIQHYSESTPAKGGGVDLSKVTIEGKVKIIRFKKKE